MTPSEKGPAGGRAAALEVTVLSRDSRAPSPSMPLDWGVAPTRHWGTPTRARGSPTKLLRADGRIKSHEALSARKAPSRALMAAKHMALSPRHQSPPARHQSPPARHESPPARHQSPPARRALLPAQQLVLPARPPRVGFNRGSAGVRAWGSAEVKGALPGRQQSKGMAAGGQGGRACPPADWQDRLLGDPSEEPKQTGGGVVGCGEEVDQVWGRYLARAKQKQGLQASGTAVMSSSQVCFETQPLVHDQKLMNSWGRHALMLFRVGAVNKAWKGGNFPPGVPGGEGGLVAQANIFLHVIAI